MSAIPPPPNFKITTGGRNNTVNYSPNHGQYDNRSVNVNGVPQGTGNQLGSHFMASSPSYAQQWPGQPFGAGMYNQQYLPQTANANPPLIRNPTLPDNRTQYGSNPPPTSRSTSVPSQHGNYWAGQSNHYAGVPLSQRQASNENQYQANYSQFPVSSPPMSPTTQSSVSPVNSPIAESTVRGTTFNQQIFETDRQTSEPAQIPGSENAAEANESQSPQAKPRRRKRDVVKSWFKSGDA